MAKMTFSLKYLIFLFFVFTASITVFGQNVTLNITAKNGGKVKLDGTVFVELWVNNTFDDYGPVLPYRLRPQINFSDHLQLQKDGHVLPDGWAIVENQKGNVRLSNGSDTIPVLSRRIILLAFKAIKESQEAKVLVNLYFSNGKPPGNKPGGSLPGDNPLDNAGYTIIKISK